MFRKHVVAIMAMMVLSGCNTTQSQSQQMVATWYMHGTHTANGERFNPDGMTAAHKKLPFNTRLRLTHKDKSVIVRINDRGPFIKGRDIDLSRGVAKILECPGICKLQAEIIND